MLRNFVSTAGASLLTPTSIAKLLVSQKHSGLRGVSPDLAVEDVDCVVLGVCGRTNSPPCAERSRWTHYSPLQRVPLLENPGASSRFILDLAGVLRWVLVHSKR